MRYAPEIPLLLAHDHRQPVGTVKLGKASASGIPFTAQIPRLAEDGDVRRRTDTAWHSVKSGLIKGVSIGFSPDEYEPNRAGGLDFTKAEIYELSLVALPCNAEALITAFKSLHESADAAASVEAGETPAQPAPENPSAQTPANTEKRHSLLPFLA